MEYLFNIYLKYRFKGFKKYLKQKKGNKATFEEDWDNPSFRKQPNNLYAGHSVKSDDCVSIQSDGLHLQVKPINEYIEHGSGNQQTYGKIGSVDYKHKPPEAYGTGIFNFIPPKESWAALGLLRHGHSPESMRTKYKVKLINKNTLIVEPLESTLPGVNGGVFDEDGNFLSRIKKYNNGVITTRSEIENIYSHVLIGSDHIIPEIDVMEIMRKSTLKHTIHYGYTTAEYRKYGFGNYIFVPTFDGREYEVAVKITPDKYKFYIDGIKTFQTKKATSKGPVYPILNNAVHPTNYTKEVCDFIITRFRYIK